jgi:ABC-type lipoprotein export system ATPase subunit
MLRFENIMPHPLKELQHGMQSIWGSDFELSFKDLTLLNASSGKGKTTFIHTIYGLRKDYVGNVYLKGHDIQNLSIDQWIDLRRNQLSVIFQDLQLIPQLSVEDNLKLKLDLGSDLTLDQIKEMLAALGLVDKWQQTCGTLSQGQQQRVAIIRALIPSFEYLLMDEPFSHLDDVNTNLALQMILNRCETLKTGCLLTTLGETYNNQLPKMLHL